MSARTDAEAAETQNATGITPEMIRSKLEEKLEASHVDIEDMSGKRLANHSLLLHVH